MNWIKSIESALAVCAVVACGTSDNPGGNNAGSGGNGGTSGTGGVASGGSGGAGGWAGGAAGMGGGSAGVGGGGGAEAEETCLAIMACVEQCGGDSACVNACENDGSPEIVAAYAAFKQCSADHFCNYDPLCMYQECPIEMAGCGF